MNEVTFGTYKSYTDLQLIRTAKSIGSPSVKKHTVKIEGADGVLDYTEYFGDVKYDNVKLSFDFETIVPQSQFLTLFSTIKNALHGRKMNISLDDDPGYYYVGRVEVSDFTNNKNIGKIKITCDCEPYKYKNELTVVTQAVNGSATIVLNNSRKRVVPQITTDAAFGFAFNGFTTQQSAGTFTIPELELVEGENTVTVTGTGNVTFKYREGGL